MLENNNHKNSTCAFAEQIVSYLYGETDAPEKTLFETHLNSCAACREEFTGFSAARRSVIEWRNEEFLSLETPSIQIPYVNAPEFYKAEIKLKSSHSLLERFGRLFSLSHAFTASAAFAAVAIFVGITFFANKSVKNVEVAESNAANIGQTTASQKFEGEKFSDTAITKDKEKNTVAPLPLEKSKSLAVETKNSGKNPILDSGIARKNLTVKVSTVSTNPVKNQNREANSPSNKVVNIDNKKPMFAQTGKIPRLNNVEEDEDKSLRLAELLDEDGAK